MAFHSISVSKNHHHHNYCYRVTLKACSFRYLLLVPPLSLIFLKDKDKNLMRPIITQEHFNYFFKFIFLCKCAPLSTDLYRLGKPLPRARAVAASRGRHGRRPSPGLRRRAAAGRRARRRHRPQGAQSASEATEPSANGKI